MFNRSLVFAVAFFGNVLTAGCASKISNDPRAPDHNYAIHFTFPSEAQLIVEPMDPEGEILVNECRDMRSTGAGYTVCQTMWQESGEPGVLRFDLISRENGSSLCEARSVPNNTIAVPLMVRLPDGRQLHVSPPIRATSHEPCHFTVATDRLEQ